jgi:hypothetical protein
VIESRSCLASVSRRGARQAVCLLLTGALLPGCLAYNHASSQELSALAEWDPAPTTEEAVPITLAFADSWLWPVSDMSELEEWVRTMFPNHRAVDDDFVLDGSGAGALLRLGSEFGVRESLYYWVWSLLTPAAPYWFELLPTATATIEHQTPFPHTHHLDPHQTEVTAVWWLPLCFVPINPGGVDEAHRLAVQGMLQSLAGSGPWWTPHQTRALQVGTQDLLAGSAAAAPYHAVWLRVESRVELEPVGDAQGVWIAVWDAEGEPLASGSAAEGLGFVTESEGSVFVQLQADQERRCQLSVSVETADEDRFGDNGSQESAAPLPGKGRFEGLRILAHDDWFAIPLQRGEAVRAAIEFSHEEGDLELSLHDVEGNSVARSGGFSDREELTFTAEEAGTYAIRVFGNMGARGFYTLEVE